VAEIRRATAADVEALVAMGRALHAESPRYRDMPLDEGKLRRLADACIAIDDAAVLVAVAAGEVVGMFVGSVQERWFGPDRYATDLTVYVKPAHRGGSAFHRLAKAFEAWARERGVTEIDIGVSTDVHTDRTVCAYERMGYTLSPTRIVVKTLTDHGH
jgi:GNAT superfamily N-acetyltransferase